jgi:uncharacterized membrane protein YbhN (UPF0104 family)
MSAARGQVVRFALGVAVIVVVLLHTGPEPVVTGVGAVDVPTLLLGVLLGVPATLACAWRWRVVAAALGVRVDAGRAVSACYAAQLLNATLPTGVAGDVHRGLAHAPAGQRITALRAVAWERSAGQAVQVAAAGLLLVLLSSPHLALGGGALHPVLLAAVTVTAAVMVTVAAVSRRWQVAWDVLRDDTRRLRAAGVVPTVVVASLLAQSTYVATGVLAARAVGVSAPLTVLVLLVAMSVPLGVAGWGPREGAAAWSFGAAGLGADAGVATAVAYGVIVTVAALPGVVALAGTARRASRRVAHEEVGHG